MPNHALEKIRDAVAADRRVGLGITGLGRRARPDEDPVRQRGGAPGRRAHHAIALLQRLRRVDRAGEGERPFPALPLGRTGRRPVRRRLRVPVHPEPPGRAAGEDPRARDAQLDGHHRSSGRHGIDRGPELVGDRAHLLHVVQTAREAGRRESLLRLQGLPSPHPAPLRRRRAPAGLRRHGARHRSLLPGAPAGRHPEVRGLVDLLDREPVRGREPRDRRRHLHHGVQRGTKGIYGLIRGAAKGFW